jgi:hypothetical protein
LSSAALAAIDPRELELAYDYALAYDDRRYAADPWAWAVEQVFTKDEATQQVRPFKDQPYVHDIFDALEAYPMVAFPKTRRVFATWAVSTWCTHRARYQPANAIFIQSENEAKSAYTVDQRCYFIETNLRTPGLRQKVEAIRTSQSLVGRMKYPNGSYIWAVPAGSDVGRTYTPSVWVLDEIEIQEHGQEAYDAALPFTEKGGRLILLGTSNGPSGVLAQLCKDVGFLRFQ